MDQSRWAKLLLFVNLPGVVSARRTRAERRRCSWIETYPFAVLMSIVIVDSPLAGFCHPSAGACRGEGKFHTAFVPAAARLHADFVAKVPQPPESTYLPPLAAFWYLKNADSGIARVQSTYLPRNSHKSDIYPQDEL